MQGSKTMHLINSDYVKFRGKRKDNGQLVYGFFFRIGLGNLRYVSAIQEIDERNIPVQHEVVPDSVSQFTGIKDCDGLEVYAGDEVKSIGAGRISGVVVFWNGAFWISGKEKNGDAGRDLLFMNSVKLVNRGLL